MFRRWRVRHCYPKPVVELVVRLMPIHGAAALSRRSTFRRALSTAGVPTSRDCVALSGNPAVDAETLATLVARCEELGGALPGTRARRPVGHALRSMHRSAVCNARVASATTPKTRLPLRRLAAADLQRWRRRAGRPARCSGCIGAVPLARAVPCNGQRYVFDACRERPERGVRSRLEAVRRSHRYTVFPRHRCATHWPRRHRDVASSFHPRVPRHVRQCRRIATSRSYGSRLRNGCCSPERTDRSDSCWRRLPLGPESESCIQADRR